jgi:dihydropteroate synthase
MGILNLTPDSFFADSRVPTTEATVHKAGQMLAAGAVLLDIGGQSTRPGAEEIGAEAEAALIIPAIQAILANYPDAVISVDTFHSSVAEAALQAGAGIVNDVSGGQRDPDIYKIAAKYDAPYILMHMRGNASTMQQMTEYGDIAADLLDYFTEKTRLCRTAGITDIILDPGFGFAKTQEQNFAILRRFHEFNILGLPLLAGLSRKSMLYRLMDTTPENALNATTAANMLALMGGAKILRVHDVREAVETIQVWEKAFATSL